MSPEISIIMPVYKTEKYLEKSIKAVLDQTFKDFELILVDDCSPDNSGKLCDEFAERDSRVRVIHMEQNSGVSAARNTAMEKARGTYLCFLDSDDYFDDNMLEILHNSVTENPAQAVIFGLLEEFIDKDGKILRTRENSPDNKVIKSKKDLRQELLRLETQDLYGYPCNKMYNLEFLRETKAQFPQMKFNEDIIFNIDFFMNAQSCNTLNFAPYHYVKHDKSKTGSYIPTYYEDIMKKIDRMYDQLNYWNMATDENLELLAMRYTRYFFSSLERNCDTRADMNEKQQKEFFKKAVESERHKSLENHLNGGGLTGIMAKALKTKSAFLCLGIAKTIALCKKFLPSLFAKIS